MNDRLERRWCVCRVTEWPKSKLSIVGNMKIRINWKLRIGKQPQILYFMDWDDCSIIAQFYSTIQRLTIHWTPIGNGMLNRQIQFAKITRSSFVRARSHIRLHRKTKCDQPFPLRSPYCVANFESCREWNASSLNGLHLKKILISCVVQF